MIVTVPTGAYIAYDTRKLDEEARRCTVLVWLHQFEGELHVKNLNWNRGDFYEVPDDWTDWTEDGGVLHTPRGDISFARATLARLSEPDIDARIGGLREQLIYYRGVRYNEDKEETVEEAERVEDEVDALLASGNDEALNAACEVLCWGEHY